MAFCCAGGGGSVGAPVDLQVVGGGGAALLGVAWVGAATAVDRAFVNDMGS